MLAADDIDIQISQDLSELLVTMFQELRSGQALGTSLDPLSSVLSTAEAINVAYSAMAEAWYLEGRKAAPSQLLRHLGGTVIKDDDDDRKRVQNYFRLVRSKRSQDPKWVQLLDGEKWL